MTDVIPLIVPDLGDAEVREVEAVLRSGRLTQGPRVAEFEASLASFVGVRHAVTTTSATTALHLTLAALDIGPGDEVAVPDFTFPATGNVVIQQGAVPVLVDVDRDTFAMDPAALARAITRATRGVIVVHPFGQAADMPGIESVARDAGIPIIEDAATAIGAGYGDRRCGAIGIAGCFSFHPRKSITTGEGGAITTDNDGLADRARVLRSHGGVPAGGRYRFEAAGYNYRLSDILAAVGVVQMQRLADIVARRSSVARRYQVLLSDVSGLGLPGDLPNRPHTYQSFVLRLPDGVDRDEVIAELLDAGVESTIGTYALHREPSFAGPFGYSPGDLAGSMWAYQRSLTIPLYSTMTTADQDRVVDALRAALRNQGAR